MCKAMEDMRDESVRKEKKETALRMLADGEFTLEKIAKISVLSLDEVKKLQAGQSI